jgi:hypothetical protein
MSSSDNETEQEKEMAMIMAAIQQLQDSVAAQGLEDDDDDASAFLEASQHHASLVARESNPLWFLK